jgi:pumilio family protein 6
VLAEILTDSKGEESPLLEIALHETGSRLLLMLLVNSEQERQKYFDPYERQVLDPNPTVLEDGERVPTSKKNPETRRKELLNHLRKPLIEMCSLHANVLIRSLPGSRVLREVYSAFRPQEVVDAVEAVCVAELSTANNDDESLSLFEDPVGHLAVKNLLSCDAHDKVLFATAFYDKMQSRLIKVGSSNRGAFVLTGLLKVEATREKTLKELSSHENDLRKLAKEGRVTAGFTALLQEMGCKGKE